MAQPGDAAVPLLDLSAQYAPIRQDIIDALTRVADSQRYILGPDVLSITYLSPAAQLAMMAVLIAVPNRRVHTVLVPIIFALFCFNHLLHPMFSDAAWVAGPRALP